jgi:xylulose-5-phosphate/fructose-6-phosphate phosphoketolase
MAPTVIAMVARNNLARFHLVSDAIDRRPQLGYVAAYVNQTVRDKPIEHEACIGQHGKDMPEVGNRR